MFNEMPSFQRYKMLLIFGITEARFSIYKLIAKRSWNKRIENEQP